MKEKILYWLKENHTHPYVLTAGGLTLAIIGSVAGFSFAQTGTNAASVDGALAEDEAIEEATEDQGSLVDIVGDERLAGSSSGNSWAGSIISLGTTPVQPAREGSIVSWMVKIGDRVYVGQPIAKLSEPPAMPDLTNMLATEAKMLAEKRAALETTKKFVVQNNAQLKTQLIGLEQSSKDSNTLLSSNVSIDQAKAAVLAMRGEIRAFLDQMVSEHVNTITNTHVASLYRGGSIYTSYGVLDQETRNTTDTNLYLLIAALKDPKALPLDEATQYLSAAVRMAHSSVYAEGVEDIRPMMKGDQEEFLDMVSKFKDAEADVSMKATEYENMNLEQKRMLVTDRKMIEEKIAENEKMLGMAEAEVKAAEAAYAAVLQGTKGGLYITAPLAGIISTIDKSVGDFVEPGMPVARVTSSTGNAQPFVRFRIPGNVRPPKSGTILKVVRPGFSEIIKEVRVTGVGASLDASGMYMADASFTEAVAWPVDASVRVIAPDSTTSVTIALSSVKWDESGKPQVWAVSEAGRIYTKNVTLGRTLGVNIEVYEGLKIGDKYIIKPTTELREDMSIDELVPKQETQKETEDESGSKSNEHENMPGM